MGIEITQAAKERLNGIEGENNYMRISLARSGCCSYTLTFYVDKKNPKDELMEIGGYRFLVTEKEKLLLKNVKAIDYGRKGLFKDFKAIMG